MMYSLITLWLLTVIVFTAVRFTGDPALLMSEYPGVREEDLAAIRTQWGLDKPYTTQYWRFISNLVHGLSRRSTRWANSVDCGTLTEITLSTTG